MTAPIEAPQFGQQETFRKTVDIKRELENTLLNTPGFLQALGRNFLAREGTKLNYGRGQLLDWSIGPRRYRVLVSPGTGLGEALNVAVYEGGVCDSADVELDIQEERGSFQYGKTHISGAPMGGAKNNQRAEENIRENVLKKLTQE